MAMTRKDYKVIAEVIKECESDFRSRAHYVGFVDDLMKVLKENNANFNKEKFKEAVGVWYEED